MKEVIIVGAGLAGCEAAYQLAQRNIKVILYEKKLVNKNDIQQLNTFAELVCSNTFRSTSVLNAVGILKKELELLDSFILDCAYKTRIPSDDALAVDREEFSSLVDSRIRNHKNITIIDQEYNFIDENKITLIAAGPLCSEEFKQQINKVIGNQKLFYLDASAPIIEKDSINFEKIYFKSRHNKEKTNSYICIPLDEQKFNDFYNDLIKAKKVELKEFEKQIFFRGCQPIEQLAITSKKVLLNGPLSPNNLEDPKTNIKPYAVVQLRRDDALDNLYNMVGFQTNLTWSEQKQIFTKLPGLENAIFRRFGVMHKNNYINSPKILNKKLQVMRRKNIFFAGQITGVEGYIESFATGIIAAFGIISYLENKKFIPIPDQTILGSLVNYITNEKLKKLKPMKANMGLIQFKDIEFESKNKKNLYIYKNSIKLLKKYLQDNKY